MKRDGESQSLFPVLITISTLIAGAKRCRIILKQSPELDRFPLENSGTKRQ
jgi:hypothetical protein